MTTYTTVSGDTWDTVALSVYEDCAKIQALMESNIKLLDISVFDSGTVISCPDIDTTDTIVGSDDLPEWRR